MPFSPNLAALVQSLVLVERAVFASGTEKSSAGTEKCVQAAVATRHRRKSVYGRLDQLGSVPTQPCIFQFPPFVSARMDPGNGWCSSEPDQAQLILEFVQNQR